MEAPFEKMADKLLRRKARTSIETIAVMEAMNLFYSLSDTACIAEDGKIWHALADMLREAKI